MDRNPIASVDEARLLARFRATGTLVERHRMHRAQAAALAVALEDQPAQPHRSFKSEPGDLRGIPVIGRGVGGVSPGTAPESAIDRIERERERNAKTAIAVPMVKWA